jgi:hypothetical protein
VAPRSIARFKGLELAYQTVIEDFINTQEKVYKAAREGEREEK